MPVVFVSVSLVVLFCGVNQQSVLQLDSVSGMTNLGTAADIRYIPTTLDKVN